MTEKVQELVIEALCVCVRSRDRVCVCVQKKKFLQTVWSHVHWPACTWSSEAKHAEHWGEN